LLRQILDEDSRTESYPTGMPAPVFGRSRVKEAPMQEYIIRGLLIGVAIVVLAFGIPYFITLFRLRSDPSAPHETPQQDAPEKTSEELEPDAVSWLYRREAIAFSRPTVDNVERIRRLPGEVGMPCCLEGSGPRGWLSC